MFKKKESGTAQVDAPLKAKKSNVFYKCKSRLLLKIINFTVPNYTARDTYKTRKPLFSQLEATKPHEKLKFEGKNFRNFFRFFFEVSGKSHSAEKCKRDPLGFFEQPFCCKISKN